MRTEEMRLMVNCFRRNDHRTNNGVEGFHSKILRKFPALNPDLWKFIIKTVQIIDYKYSLEDIQIDIGQGNVRKRRLCYREMEARIVHIKNEFLAHTRSALEFVRSISRMMMGL